MTNPTDKMGRLVTFRCQEELATALETAAQKSFCPVSVIARIAAAEEMRRRGLLIEEPA
jgi:hypothetical protein